MKKNSFKMNINYSSEVVKESDKNYLEKDYVGIKRKIISVEHDNFNGVDL